MFRSGVKKGSVMFKCMKRPCLGLRQAVPNPSQEKSMKDHKTKLP